MQKNNLVHTLISTWLYYVIYSLKFPMEIGARCYLMDDADRVLLVKHASEQPWVLPWWHIEEWETIYECLEREIHEELWLWITIIWAENVISSHSVAPLPLPISIHKVSYEHRERWPIQKMEYIFFARMSGEVTNIQKEEIYDYTRVEVDDLLEMKPEEEIHEFVQEILDQNIDLLEIIG